MNLIDEINRLKKEKNAIILAHYYQNKEIQDIADYLGDSLYLAEVAKKTTANIIVFCGVHFMAETAKILNPTKKVLLPVLNAGCLMADMINAKALKEYKDNHPDTKIIAYVNTTASTKALSDCICTSTNALKIINHYIKNGNKILYCPDQNLAKYAMKEGNISFDVWNGCCPIHHYLDKNKVLELKKDHPNALIIAHPECRLDILEIADYVGSTKQMLDFTIKDVNNEYIVCTEKGVISAMEKANPNKKFYLASPTLTCASMKCTTLNDVYNCLKEEKNEIEVNELDAIGASKALNKMLELS